MAAVNGASPVDPHSTPEFDVEREMDSGGSYEVCESEFEAEIAAIRARENGGQPSAPMKNGHSAKIASDAGDGSDGGSLVADEDDDALDDDALENAVAAPTDVEVAPARRAELRGWPRFEAWVERLAAKYRFIRKLTSRLYLPIAFHSGLTMKKLDPHRFTYVLPFRRFNRNFYDAMAGAALVANSEIAAGMYLFGELGGKWTVVCKNISYRFLRPCLGPAIYQVNPLDDVKALLSAGAEFNIDLTLEILQQVSGRRRHPRVGRCEVTFHCAPKGPEGNRGLRSRRRRRRGK